MTSAKEFCMLCGIFVVLSYIFELLIDLNMYLFEAFSVRLFMVAGSFFQYMQSAFDIVFIFLLFAFFFKKELSFLQKFMKCYPKLSLYTMYIGWFSFILFAIDMLFFAGIYFIPMSTFVQELIGNFLLVANVVCLIAAIFMATKKIFYTRKDAKI